MNHNLANAGQYSDSESGDNGIILYGASVVDLDYDRRFSPKHLNNSQKQTIDSEAALNSQASFDKGMLIWMQLHRGVYFWMRAFFQIMAFSFLIVTLLMLRNFGDDYWHRTLAMLAAKHCLNMLSYTVDLVAFSMKKVHWIKYKLSLDIVSVILIVAV